MSAFSKIKVAVLRGGPSNEYEVSLKTGEHVLAILRDMPDSYEPIDIFISREGDWHRGGRTLDPHKALFHTDVVFNALHGAYGEDGQVQRLLSNLHIPFTGSKAVPSALAMQKHLAKKAFADHGLKTPRHELLVEEDLRRGTLVEIFRSYLHPLIVKPASGGSSLGLHLVYTFDELYNAVNDVLKDSPQVLVEEFIRGKEATCGVVEKARGEKLYAFMPVEIQKSAKKPYFDFKDKYSGKAKELCPGTFTTEENKKIEDAAKRAHEALGLRHYSRSDFIITSRGNVYVLETNSLPGLTEESLLPKSFHALGWQPRDFVDHVVRLALDA